MLGNQDQASKSKQRTDTGGTMLKKLSLSLIAAINNLTSGGSGGEYKNVSINDLKNSSETNKLILDVRQPDEFAQGHVPGAKLIPLGNIKARLAEVPNDAPVYVVCQSGGRSQTASDLLSKNGKSDVRNVQGGTSAWKAAGFPVQR
jgi:rhodanese-related sulfurtransferase